MILKGGDKMGVIKDKNVKKLAELLSGNDGSGSVYAADKTDDLRALFAAFSVTEDKKARSRMLADFRRRNTEFADFIAKNPELLKAELERAVLMAAVGGRSEETEISVDSRGRRTVKRSIKQTAPNAAAAFRYLEKAAPEIWGDNASGKAPENNLLEILRACLSGSSEVEEKESEGEG